MKFFRQVTVHAKVCYNELFKNRKERSCSRVFSQEALDFLNDIRFNNHQQFYEANRTRYEAIHVQEPLRELGELAPAG